MPNFETSNTKRQEIVDAYRTGSTPKEISRVLLIKLSTVHEIIKVYKNEDRINKKLRGRRASKLNDHQKEQIKLWVFENCSTTLKSIRAKVFESYQISISERTIAKILSGFQFSYKRTQVQPVRRNDEAALISRETYAREFMAHYTAAEEKTFVFIDEVGFCVSMRSRYGRSIVGTPAIQVVPSVRTKNFSVCCAITNQKMLQYKIQSTAFNNVTFKTFLEELWEVIQRESIMRPVFVMDNVRFHKSVVTQTLLQNNNQEFLYLAPYSPILNPIENCFSKWKQFAKQASPQNEEGLMAIIDNGAAQITPIDCSHFFRHMMGYLPRCMAREIIEN
jgi:transposase